MSGAPALDLCLYRQPQVRDLQVEAILFDSREAPGTALGQCVLPLSVGCSEAASARLRPPPHVPRTRPQGRLKFVYEFMSVECAIPLPEGDASPMVQPGGEVEGAGNDCDPSIGVGPPSLLSTDALSPRSRAETTDSSVMSPVLPLAGAVTALEVCGTWLCSPTELRTGDPRGSRY